MAKKKLAKKKVSIKNEADKKTKKTPSKKSTANSEKRPLCAAKKQQLFFLMLAIFVPALCLLLTKLTLVSDAVQAGQDYAHAQLITSVEQELQHTLTHLTNATQKLADHPTVLSITSSRSSDQLLQLETLLTQAMPMISSLHIIPLGSAKIRIDSELLNFSMLNLIKKLEKNQPQPLQIIKRPDTTALVYGKPILNNSAVIGSLIITAQVNPLFQRLPHFNQQEGFLDIHYSAPEEESNQSFYTTGNTAFATISQGKTININDLNWKIKVYIAPEVISNGINKHFYWIIFALGASLITTILFFSYSKLNRLVEHNVKSLTGINSTLPNQNATSQKGPKYHWYSFFEADEAIQKIRNNAKKAKEKQNVPDSKTPIKRKADADTIALLTSDEPSQSEEDDFMDLDINFEDEDLFAPAAPKEKEKLNITIPHDIFRQYDIRGIVGQSLTIEFVSILGQAIGSYTLNKGPSSLVVGRDGRLSSLELSEALIDGILQSGCDVVDIGEVPTPLVYFAAATSGAQSGVMITGSHNPPEYNGFKMVVKGETLFGQHILDIKSYLEKNTLKSGEGKLTQTNPSEDYIRKITSNIVLPRPLKVVIDAGNGVAGPLAVQLVEQLGCEAIPLYCDIDGHFPNHHPDPSKPANLVDLIKTVKAEQADVGIALDGDGDRLGVITPAGKMLFPDRLLMLFARHILENSEDGGTVIYDVKCSGSLNAFVKALNGTPIMWKTGHSLIKAKMKETQALLAGEMSGHIFFNDRWYGFDDALYSTARLLEIIASETTGIDTMMTNIPELSATPELNIAVSDTEKFEIIKGLSKTGIFSEGKVTTIDGIRVDYQFGWGLVRASNTTPCLVARFEARTEKQLEVIQAEFRKNLLQVKNDLVIPF